MNERRSSLGGSLRSRAKATLGALACAVSLFSVGGCSGTGGWSQPAVHAEAAYKDLSATTLAEQIAHGDDSESARKALRGMGPPGLDAALALYDSAKKADADAGTLARLSAAADTAAAQHDAVRTRLYWYTDLKEAERAAEAQHKPILSLRMLGHLDEELSCANSRFFRTTLYPDHDVNERLRNEVILHWSSERPVPIVTIDYGDGRVVRRTITGNSIHYILDPRGHVVDALPGLYAPTQFVQALEAARAVALETSGSETEREQTVAEFHETALAIARERWTHEASAVGFLGAPSFAPNAGMKPSALLAIPSAPSKAAVEMPIARSVSFELPARSDLDRVPWEKLGERLRGSVRLDDASRSAMRDKAPLDWSTGKPKPLDDAGFTKLVSKFEEHVAQDMAQNEYFFHPQIRRWLAQNPGISLEALNQRVYSELFLTPDSDPWLGLVPPVVYSGIQGDGFAPAK